MTIKAIKEQYKDYEIARNGGKNSFVVTNLTDAKVKAVIIVNVHNVGKSVIQLVRVSDGEELFKNGECRPCDSLEDALDVAEEIVWDNKISV